MRLVDIRLELFNDDMSSLEGFKQERQHIVGGDFVGEKESSNGEELECLQQISYSNSDGVLDGMATKGSDFLEISAIKYVNLPYGCTRHQCGSQILLTEPPQASAVELVGSGAGNNVVLRGGEVCEELRELFVLNRFRISSFRIGVTGRHHLSKRHSFSARQTGWSASKGGGALIGGKLRPRLLAREEVSLEREAHRGLRMIREEVSELQQAVRVPLGRSDSGKKFGGKADSLALSIGDKFRRQEVPSGWSPRGEREEEEEESYEQRRRPCLSGHHQCWLTKSSGLARERSAAVVAASVSPGLRACWLEPSDRHKANGSASGGPYLVSSFGATCERSGAALPLDSDCRQNVKLVTTKQSAPVATETRGQQRGPRGVERAAVFTVGDGRVFAEKQRSSTLAAKPPEHRNGRRKSTEAPLSGLPIKRNMHLSSDGVENMSAQLEMSRGGGSLVGKSELDPADRFRLSQRFEERRRSGSQDGCTDQRNKRPLLGEGGSLTNGLAEGRRGGRGRHLACLRRASLTGGQQSGPKRNGRALRVNEEANCCANLHPLELVDKRTRLSISIYEPLPFPAASLRLQGQEEQQGQDQDCEEPSLRRQRRQQGDGRQLGPLAARGRHKRLGESEHAQGWRRPSGQRAAAIGRRSAAERGDSVSANRASGSSGHQQWRACNRSQVAGGGHLAPGLRKSAAKPSEFAAAAASAAQPADLAGEQPSCEPNILFVSIEAQDGRQSRPLRIDSKWSREQLIENLQLELIELDGLGDFAAEGEAPDSLREAARSLATLCQEHLSAAQQLQPQPEPPAGESRWPRASGATRFQGYGGATISSPELADPTAMSGPELSLLAELSGLDVADGIGQTGESDTAQMAPAALAAAAGAKSGCLAQSGSPAEAGGEVGRRPCRSMGGPRAERPAAQQREGAPLGRREAIGAARSPLGGGEQCGADDIDDCRPSQLALGGNGGPIDCAVGSGWQQSARQPAATRRAELGASKTEATATTSAAAAAAAKVTPSPTPTPRPTPTLTPSSGRQAEETATLPCSAGGQEAEGARLERSVSVGGGAMAVLQVEASGAGQAEASSHSSGSRAPTAHARSAKQQASGGGGGGGGSCCGNESKGKRYVRKLPSLHFTSLCFGQSWPRSHFSRPLNWMGKPAVCVWSSFVASFIPFC